VVDHQLKRFLSSRLKVPVTEISAVGRGCINKTYKIITSDNHFFSKTNSASKFPHLFLKEKNGLALLAKQKLIKLPEVIDYCCFEDRQILILEWIKEGERNQEFWKSFGRQLAALHQVKSEQFGLEEDNYMGSVPQSNKHHNSWISFFIEARLMPLIKLCSHSLSSTNSKQFEVFYQKLPTIFDNEKPSLLHGDLWSGNFMCNDKNQPVLIDPAVYFGHPSVDLGMTTLFGGFEKSFYEAYHYHWPLPPNYKEQWKACNLYPLLIHLHLFGKSYLGQIEQTLADFV
jgi:protein-ribulosamine 3-kinase